MIHESRDGGKTYTSRPMRESVSHKSSNNSKAQLPNHMTSIEWLIKELYTEMNMSGDGRVLDEILEEAKEMHKKEHGDTWDAALLQGSKRAGNFMRAYEDFDNYYQETFVSKGSDECQFEPTTNTSSATICKHCGREKLLHTT